MPEHLLTSFLTHLTGQKTDQEKDEERQKQETAEGTKLKEAQIRQENAKADEEEARAKLYSKTDPNKPRGGGSYKDIPLGTLRAMHDTYLNRSKTLPLSPSEQSEFDAISESLNQRLQIKPNQSKPTQPESSGSGMMGLLQWLASPSQSQPTKTNQPSWKDYDK